jgi:hypothetical protein
VVIAHYGNPKITPLSHPLLFPNMTDKILPEIYQDRVLCYVLFGIMSLTLPLQKKVQREDHFPLGTLA